MIDVLVTAIEVPNENPLRRGAWDRTPFGAFGEPDLTLTVGSTHHECPDNQYSCPLALRFDSQPLSGSLPISMVDRDPMGIEQGPNEMLRFQDVLGNGPRERAPIGFVDRRHTFPDQVTVYLRARER